MFQFFQWVTLTASRLDLWGLLDIIVVAAIIFGLLRLISGTSAQSVLYGIILLLLAMMVVLGMPQLTMLNWLLRNTLPLISIALIVLFQPELRRAVERIGRVRRIINLPSRAVGIPRAIEEIALTCAHLSKQRNGALIVLERETGLQDFAETGIAIDGLVSATFLLSIFAPNSPLHDGAVIIQGDRLLAARCVLPLSESHISTPMGTRHKAAVGITERTDAIAIAISEETGMISLANNGRVIRSLDQAKLAKALGVLYRGRSSETFLNWPRRQKAWKGA